MANCCLASLQESKNVFLMTFLYPHYSFLSILCVSVCVGGGVGGEGVCVCVCIRVQSYLFVWLFCFPLHIISSTTAPVIEMYNMNSC